METYNTISEMAWGELEIKRSRFIGCISPVADEDEAKAFLLAQREQHPEARHICYAYILREDNRIRYSDDGEPSGTAGLPILRVLEGAGLKDVVCTVTRYFGGTLLGTGGLVRAYTDATKIALASAKIFTMQPVRDLRIVVPYALFDQLAFLIDTSGGLITTTTYLDVVTVECSFVLGDEASFLTQVQELTHGEANIEMGDARFGMMPS